MTKLRSVSALILFLLLACTASAPAQSPKPAAAPDTLTFAVIGDNGTGDKAQQAVADQMWQTYQQTPFPLVLMLGDNLYAGNWKRIGAAFEKPYKPLLDAGVRFYATLGNHDIPTAEQQIAYPLFNMGGQRHYSFSPAGSLVEFFAVDSSDPANVASQIQWLDGALAASTARWKIVFVHHPPYSPGTRHGDNAKLEKSLVPVLERNHVQVVFSGHEHFFAQMAPVNGVNYVISGSGGKIQRGGIQKDARLLAGNDVQHQFLLVVLKPESLALQVIGETGTVLYSSALPYPTAAAAAAAH